MRYILYSLTVFNERVHSVPFGLAEKNEIPGSRSQMVCAEEVLIFWIGLMASMEVVTPLGQPWTYQKKEISEAPIASRFTLSRDKVIGELPVKAKRENYG